MAAAKRRLEAILSEELEALMALHTAVERETKGSENHEQVPQSSEHESEEHKRPSRSPGATDARPSSFGTGCGTSSAPAYASAFLGVLRQTEVEKGVVSFVSTRSSKDARLTRVRLCQVLKTKLLAASAEKIALADRVTERDKQLAQLTEEIGFFRDALAKVRLLLQRLEWLRF